MSAENTKLNEPNAGPVATVKLELPGEHQKKQGLRRIFQEYPRGGRAAAVLLLAVVIVGGALFVSNSLATASLGGRLTGVQRLHPGRRSN